MCDSFFFSLRSSKSSSSSDSCGRSSAPRSRVQCNAAATAAFPVCARSMYLVCHSFYFSTLLCARDRRDPTLTWRRRAMLTLITQIIKRFNRNQQIDKPGGTTNDAKLSRLESISLSVHTRFVMLNEIDVEARPTTRDEREKKINLNSFYQWNDLG